jgi:hypothetical protein
LEQNKFLLKYLNKEIFPKNDFTQGQYVIGEDILYKKAKKMDPAGYRIIDSIKEKLKKENILLITEKRNEYNEFIKIDIEYNKIKLNFIFTILPTRLEIQSINRREKLRQKNLQEEVSKIVLKLTPKQSVNLINNVLGFEKLQWLSEFRKGKLTRDGGIDFFGKLCVTKDDEIAYDAYGHVFPIYGQLKHLKGKMTEPSIRDFVGTMTKSHSKIQYGIVISSRGFTPDSKKFIEETVISKNNSIKEIFCFDIEFITELMIKHKIGLISEKIHSGLFIDEDWLGEIKFFDS